MLLNLVLRQRSLLHEEAPRIAETMKAEIACDRGLAVDEADYDVATFS